MELVIRVPGTPPGPNVRYSHWAKRARVVKQWRDDARLVALDARNRSGIQTFPWEAVRVRYEYVSPIRRFPDPDNAIAACKPILDGIVSAGVIVNDDRAHVSLEEPRFRVERGRRFVDVVVSRVGDVPVAPIPPSPESSGS
jgi:hypothetical protein